MSLGYGGHGQPGPSWTAQLNCRAVHESRDPRRREGCQGAPTAVRALLNPRMSMLLCRVARVCKGKGRNRRLPATGEWITGTWGWTMQNHRQK
ncbi:hypothetical protein GCM10017687_24300 [Streptomyces echinatus]